jgi:hypothetical protein
MRQVSSILAVLVVAVPLAACVSRPESGFLSPVAENAIGARRRTRRTWRHGTREVGAATIEASSGGHPALPAGAVRPTAVLIPVEAYTSRAIAQGNRLAVAFYPRRLPTRCDWATWKPSIRSSPWIRDAPHSAFSLLIRWMRSRRLISL